MTFFAVVTGRASEAAAHRIGTTPMAAAAYQEVTHTMLSEFKYMLEEHFIPLVPLLLIAGLSLAFLLAAMLAIGKTLQRRGSGSPGLKQDDWVALLLATLIAVPVLASTGYLVARYHGEASVAHRFEAQIARYLEIGAGADADVGSAYSGYSAPYRRAIVVSEHKGIENDLFFSLPDALRARSPEEVGVVVLVDRREEPTASYTDGASALQKVVEVKVVDEQQQAVIGRETFYGGDPPESKAGSGDKSGDSPDEDEIVEFIATSVGAG